MMDQNALDNLLTCGVCLGRLHAPRRLPCQHYFCLQCLQGVMDSGQYRSRLQLVCPECRAEHRIQALSELPTGDLKVTQLLEMVNSAENNCCACNQPFVTSCFHCHNKYCPDCHISHIGDVIMSKFMRVRRNVPGHVTSTEDYKEKLMGKIKLSIESARRASVSSLNSYYDNLNNGWQHFMDVNLTKDKLDTVIVKASRDRFIEQYKSKIIKHKDMRDIYCEIDKTAKLMLLLETYMDSTADELIHVSWRVNDLLNTSRERLKRQMNTVNCEESDSHAVNEEALVKAENMVTDTGTVTSNPLARDFGFGGAPQSSVRISSTKPDIPGSTVKLAADVNLAPSAAGLSSCAAAYKPTPGQDWVDSHLCTTRHHCITAMVEYENMSVEELRYQHYIDTGTFNHLKENSGKTGAGKPEDLELSGIRTISHKVSGIFGTPPLTFETSPLTSLLYAGDCTTKRSPLGVRTPVIVKASTFKRSLRKGACLKHTLNNMCKKNISFLHTTTTERYFFRGFAPRIEDPLLLRPPQSRRYYHLQDSTTQDSPDSTTQDCPDSTTQGSPAGSECGSEEVIFVANAQRNSLHRKPDKMTSVESADIVSMTSVESADIVSMTSVESADIVSIKKRDGLNRMTNVSQSQAFDKATVPRRTYPTCTEDVPLQDTRDTVVVPLRKESCGTVVVPLQDSNRGTVGEPLQDSRHTGDEPAGEDHSDADYVTVSEGSSDAEDTTICESPRYQVDLPVCEDPRYQVDLPVCEDPRYQVDLPVCEDPRYQVDLPVCEDPRYQVDLPVCEDPRYNEDLHVGVCEDPMYNEDLQVCEDPRYNEDLPVCEDPMYNEGLPVCEDPTDSDDQEDHTDHSSSSLFLKRPKRYCEGL